MVSFNFGTTECAPCWKSSMNMKGLFEALISIKINLYSSQEGTITKLKYGITNKKGACFTCLAIWITSEQQVKFFGFPTYDVRY